MRSWNAFNNRLASVVAVSFCQKIKTSLQILAASSLVFSASATILQAEECEEEFARSQFSRVLTTQEARRIRVESHSILELINENPKENLIYQHPAIVMDAWQRYQSIHNKFRPEQELSPGFGGELVNLYPLYQTPMPENGGVFIVDQHDVVQTFHEAIAAGANGDGSAVKTLTFEGSPGTGKTRFLEIMMAIGQYHTQFDPDSFMYTIEWHDLAAIPELRDIARTHFDLKGDLLSESPLRSAIYDSVFALLPFSLQERALAMVNERAVDLSGVRPQPVRQLNPQNELVMNAIIDHYSKDYPNGEISDLEIVKVLDKHVRIKRFVLGHDGSEGKIPYQGKDVEWSGLAFTTNPLIASLYGPKHPFAYHYNGSILSTNGGPLLFDEFWRNTEPVRDFTLDIQESRKLQRGGSRVIKLDVIAMAASNTESINKVRSGDETSGAQLDRARTKPMPSSTDPRSVYKLLLEMKGRKNLFQRRLTRSNESTTELAPIVKLEAKDLFPARMRRADPYLMPEGRFALFYDVGPRKEPVAIAPWTIPLIAFVTAATRMVTDPAKAAEVGQQLLHVTQTQVFRDEIQRLKALIGDVQISAAEENELKTLSGALREGSRGITPRDTANVWLTEVLNAAQRNGADNTATPFLAKKVFLHLLLHDHEFKVRDNTEITRYLSLIDRVINEIILPRIESDVDRALSEGVEDMTAVYDDILRELIALSQDGTATTYETTQGQPARINKDRLNEIARVYREVERRDLVPSNIINMEMYGVGSNVNGERRRHPGLMKAIQQYHAELVLKQTSLDAIVRYAREGKGTDAVRASFERLATHMTNTLGYNRRALIDAIELIKEKKSRTAQVTKP